MMSHFSDVCKTGMLKVNESKNKVSCFRDGQFQCRISLNWKEVTYEGVLDLEVVNSNGNTDETGEM